MSSDVGVIPTHSFGREWVLFVAVGLGVTATNVLLYLAGVYIAGLRPSIAAGIAFILLVPIHFFSYSKIVFRSGSTSFKMIFCYAATLAVSFLLNVGLVDFYWGVLLAEPISALVLSLGPAVLANYVLFKFYVFQPSAKRNLLSFTTIANLLIIFVAIVAIYLSVASMLLYFHSFLFSDDWRLYYDYFFRRTFFESIFGRQNGHLMIVPNAIFFGNYALFGGRMIVSVLFSVATLGMSGLISALVIVRALKFQNVRPIERIAAASVVLLLAFLLTAPVTLYWGMGVHNHFTVLGAVGAAFFASGMARPVLFFPGFLVCAVLASTSFSTGVAVWGLGFAGAVVARTRPATVLLYFFLGITGALVTSGYFTSDIVTSRLTIPPLNTLALSIPTFIGNAPGHFFLLGRSNEVLSPSTLAFGSFGLIGYLMLTFRVFYSMYRQRTSDLEKAYTFFWLICGFVVIAGFLIAIGEHWDSGGVLQPRFATWSTLFWGSLCATSLLSIAECFKRYLGIHPVAVLWIFTVATAVIFINTHVITHKLRYMYSYQADRISQVAINQEYRPTVDTLWRVGQSQVTQQISGDLRAKRLNLYAEEWPHLMGENLRTTKDDTPNSCTTRFYILSTTRHDEWIVRGWIWPEKDSIGTIKTVYFLDETGKVVGFAKQIFGPPHTGDRSYIEGRPLTSRILHATQLPLLADLPGVSGHFRGRVNSVSESTEKLKAKLSVLGEDASGKWCSVKII